MQVFDQNLTKLRETTKFIYPKLSDFHKINIEY